MTEIEKLLVVQEHDVRIRQIERELRDIPQRKKIEEERLATHLQQADQAGTELKSRQAKLKDLELEAETHKEKILKLRRQQLDLKTNKEFQAMESEVKAVQIDIKGLEDRELEIMSQMEEATRALDAKKQALAAENATVQRDITAWDGRAAELEREVADLRAVRDAAAAQIREKSWLGQYQRVFTRKDNALVALEGGICGGCHLQLPPYVLHEVRKQVNLVTCDFCGRLLYQK